MTGKLWTCRVIYRRNETNDTGEAQLSIPAPGPEEARAWGRDQFMQDRADDLDRGRIVFLAVRAELEAETQLELF